MGNKSTKDRDEILKSRLDGNGNPQEFNIEYNNKFKFLIENMGKGLLFVDNDDVIRFANKKFCAMLGYERDEIIGLKSESLLVSDEDKKILKEKYTLRSKGISDTYEIRNRKKDNTEIWVEVSGTTIHDDDGIMIGTAGLATDITDVVEKRKSSIKTHKILEVVSQCMEMFLVSEDFEKTLKEVLGKLRETTGVDRACIYENFENGGEIYTNQVMESVSEGIEPHINTPEFQGIPFIKSGLGRWVELLQAGEPVFGSSKSFPEGEKKALEELNLKSVVALPIRVSGRWWGFLGFDELNFDRQWTEAEIESLVRAARGIGTGMENWLAKKNLKKSEEDFRRLFEFGPTGMAVKTIDGHYIRVNKVFCEILGYTNEEITGQHYGKYTHPDDLFKEIETAELLLSSKAPYQQLEKRYIGKSGEIIEAIVQVSLERDANGFPLYYFSQIIDITQRKKAELERGNIEKIYRAIFENANDAIFIEDENENIIDVNEHACGLTGYTREELMEMRTVDLQPKEYEKYEMREDDRFDTQIVNKSGVVLDVDLTVTKIVQDDKVLLISIVRDITDKKKSQQQMKIAKEAAEESDMVKSHFLAQMSHEIRTPINAILGYTQLIREQIEPHLDDELRSDFDIIESASQRLMRTIDLILRMSEIQTGNYQFIPREINLETEILENLYKQFKISAEKKDLKLVLNNNADPAVITGDEFSIMQIFSNLIGNAIKYTNEGSIHIDIVREDKELCVKIIDTGIGISKEYIPHLFQLFSQEEKGYTRKFEGNGLGLALVQKYCEMNNARIDVESEKHKGSTFMVCFPKE